MSACDADRDLHLRVRAAARIRRLLGFACDDIARTHIIRFAADDGLSVSHRATLAHVVDSRRSKDWELGNNLADCAPLFPLAVLAEWVRRLEAEPEIATARLARRLEADAMMQKTALAIETRVWHVDRIRDAMCDGLLCSLVLGFTVSSSDAVHIHLPCRLEQTSPCDFRVRPFAAIRDTHITEQDAMPPELEALRTRFVKRGTSAVYVDMLWTQVVPLLVGRERPDVAHRLHFDESSCQWFFTPGTLDAVSGAAVCASGSTGAASDTDLSARQRCLGRLFCQYLEIAAAAWRRVAFAVSPRSTTYRVWDEPTPVALFPSVVDPASVGAQGLRFMIGSPIGSSGEAEGAARGAQKPVVFRSRWSARRDGSRERVTPPDSATFLSGLLAAHAPAANPLDVTLDHNRLVHSAFFDSLVGVLSRFVTHDPAAIVCAFCGLVPVADALVPPLTIATQPMQIDELRPITLL